QYFPTRGSTFQLSLATTHGRNDSDAGLGYSKTWTSAGGTTWIASFHTPDPSTRIEVQRPLEPFWDARQARFFLQLGVGQVGNNTRGSPLLSGGFATGVRFDSKRFGIVTFWVLGSKSWNK